MSTFYSALQTGGDSFFFFFPLGELLGELDPHIRFVFSCGRQ